MSERAAAAGDTGAGFQIEHKGKTYSLRPVLSEGTMLDVEMAFYNRALKAVYAQREYMSAEAYDKELATLREKFEVGEYAFESPKTAALLQTQKGAMVLLGCLLSADASELMELFLAKGPELKSALQSIIKMSFPKGTPGKKPKAPR